MQAVTGGRGCGMLERVDERTAVAEVSGWAVGLEAGPELDDGFGVLSRGGGRCALN